MRASDYIQLEDQHGAHNYHPMPVVLSRGEGVFVYDVDGRRYFDCLSAYSAVNQGHCHPRIVEAMTEQVKKLTLASRAFYNDQLGLAEQYLCNLFTYEKVLLMNSGAEAVETAIKLARRWGYDKKRVAVDQALIVVANDNFHGRTSTIVSFSTDPESYAGFGPAMPGFLLIPFNDVSALEAVLSLHKDRVVAFMVEPIQGEAGVRVPDEGYLRMAYDLCQRYGALLIADEIQCGLGRAGELLASHADDVRPDIVLLGKALSGGVIPVSCVLADDEIMLCIKPGQHGSTFGGNPVASVVLRASLDVLKDEGLIENSRVMGKVFRAGIDDLRHEYPQVVKAVRGRGLMNALDIEAFENKKKNAWELCLMMKDRGLLCKPTHSNTIRLSPPLVINAEQVKEVLAIIRDSVADFARLVDGEEQGKRPALEVPQ